MAKDERNAYTIQNDASLGEVKIADEVVAIIAALAATEVDGVASMAGNITNEVIGKLGIKNLSKGYRQRVGLAQALIGNPKVLILDEPTVGLDPKQIIEIRTLIRKLGKNHTVILSSHILSEVQAVCDKIIVINEGKVVANDTEEHLSQKLSGEHKLTAKIQGDKDKIVRAMQGIKGVEKVICDASHKDGVNDIRIEAKEGVDIRRDVFETVVKNGWYMLELKTSELSLEDIFLKLTMGEALPALENTSDKEGND